MRTTCRPPRGLSLLEVLIASTIFISVFAGIAFAWKSNETSVRKLQDRSCARLVAQLAVDKMMSEPYLKLWSFACYLEDPTDVRFNGAPGPVPPEYVNFLSTTIQVERGLDAQQFQAAYRVKSVVRRRPSVTPGIPPDTMLDLLSSVYYTDQGTPREYSVSTTLFCSKD